MSTFIENQYHKYLGEATNQHKVLYHSEHSDLLLPLQSARLQSTGHMTYTKAKVVKVLSNSHIRYLFISRLHVHILDSEKIINKKLKQSHYLFNIWPYIQFVKCCNSLLCLLKLLHFILENKWHFRDLLNSMTCKMRLHIADNITDETQVHLPHHITPTLTCNM